jgi:hypothetical protein
MIKNSLILIVFCIVPGLLSAQESMKPNRKHGIGMVPQYAFINGFRLDFDIRTSKAKPQWLIVAPQVFMSSENPVLWNYDQMWGLGLELQQRHFLKPDVVNPEGVYFGFGPMFQFFSIEDERLYSKTVVENGNTYTEVIYGPVTTNVYKAGFTATAGYQVLVYNTLYFDFYVGAGIRLSFDNEPPSGLHRIYNDMWIDYGYSGTLMTGGLRIGMLY